MFRLTATIFIFLATIGMTRAASTDSLRAVLAQTQDSSARLTLLYDISRALRFSDPEDALKHAREALATAQNIGNDTFELRILGLTAFIFMQIEDMPTALEYALELEALAQRYGDDKWHGNSLNTLGSIYYLQKDYDRARSYYERSLGIRRKIGDTKRVGGNLNNIAKVLTAQKRYEETEAYLNEAISINRSENNWQWLCYNYYNLGIMELRRADYPASISYLQQSIAIADSHNFDGASTAAMILIAEARVAQGNNRIARQILQAVVSPERAPELEDQAAAYKQLAAIAREAGIYRDAYDYLKKSVEIGDSLRDFSISNQITNIEAQNRIKAAERIEQIQLETAAIEASSDLERTRLTSYIYLLGFLVFLVTALGFFAAFWVHRRNSRRLAQLVDQRSQELERSNEALNTFVYRSSHEVRGTITSIQGLHQLIAEQYASAQEIIPLMGSKIRQLEKVQRNLVMSMELNRGGAHFEAVDLRILLQDVIHNLRQEHGNDKVDFRMEMPNRAIWETDPHLMRAIFENLLDNSIVFRSTERNPWCRIQADIERDQLRLTIEDNGLGIKDEDAQQAFEMFFRGSNASGGSGLGLYIVRMAVEKLAGEIRFGSKADPGTVIQIDLPLSKPDQRAG